MALIRCTCIYRSSTSTEQAQGGSALVVVCRDPGCRASATHERAERALRAASVSR